MEPHGLAIKEEIKDYYEGEIYHGRLYPNLDTLVEKGLVVNQKKTGELTSIPSHGGVAKRSNHVKAGKTNL